MAHFSIQINYCTAATFYPVFLFISKINISGKKVSTIPKDPGASLSSQTVGNIVQITILPFL